MKRLLTSVCTICMLGTSGFRNRTGNLPEV